MLTLLCTNMIFAQASLPPTHALLPIDQKKIAVRFHLLLDGGAIDLVTQTSPPATLRETARRISDKLEAGEFELRLLADRKAPPNLQELKKHKTAFVYRTEEITNGLRIRITTATPKPRALLHDFLRFESDDAPCDPKLLRP